MKNRIVLLLVLMLAVPAHAQQAATEVTSEVPFAGMQLQLQVRDSGSDTSGNGNVRLDAGEYVQLSIGIANLGDTLFPGSLLTLIAEGVELAGNQVELPELAAGEGVEFEVGADAPLDLTDVSLVALFQDLQGEYLKDFSFVVSGGTFVDPAATSSFSWAGASTAATETTAVTDEVLLGRLQGEVIDLGTGGVKEGALVTANLTPAPVSGPTSFTTTTGIDGRFVLDVPPGMYELLVQAEGAPEQREQDVRVRANLAQKIDFTVGEDRKTSVEEFVVMGRADTTRASVQLVIRKKSAVVSDAISAEEISRAGDSSASGAVRRSVGTSVVGGKFIYVRGLGERYTYSLFDKVKLPSPEPNKKVVPLDIFPTSVIASVAIAKTAAPDIPGDFAGGAVKIESRRFPAEQVRKISLGLSGNTLTTGQDMYSYAGAAGDWTGYDFGSRSIPSAIPDPSRKLIAGGYYSADDMTLIAREFNNDFVLQKRKGLPGIKGSLTFGDTVDVGNNQLGYLSYISFGNDFERTQQVRRKLRVRDGANGEKILEESTDFRGEEGTQKSSLTVLENLTLKLRNNHVLSESFLYTNKTSITGRRLAGYEQNYNGELEYSSMRFVRRSLLFNRLGGEHVLGDFQLDWYGAASRAARDEPDWRELVRTKSEGENTPQLWLVKSSSGSHFWSDLQEPSYSGGADGTFTFAQWAGLESRAKFGGVASSRQREFNVRRMRFLPTASADPAHPALEPADLINDDQIGTNIRLEEGSRPTDNYEAREDVYAGYAMLELPFADPFRILAGLRYEHSLVSVTTFDPFAVGVQAQEARLVNDDFLPSVNLVYSLAEDMNIRLAGSQTVARPDFHELSPFALADFYAGQEVKGNPALKQTSIWNVDLRWEWFPAEDEVVALSGFYKSFVDPIEQVVLPSGQQTISYANAKEADLWGLELEARKGLGFISKAAENLYLGGNLTYINSEVELDPNSGIQTNSKRSLQGQSDILVNAFAGFDNDRTAAQLTFNTFSERIAQAGAFGMPDIFEVPFYSLNLNLTQKVKEDWAVSFGVDNLLNDAQEYKQGDEIVKRDYTGVDLSLGVSYTF